MIDIGIAKLADPPVDNVFEPAIEKLQIESSFESLTYGSQERSDYNTQIENNTDGPCVNAPNPCTPISFTKHIDKDTGVCEWVFFFTTFNFGRLNDFVNKLFLVKPQDKVFIHGPSNLYTDDAEVIVSALQNCASQDITISSPYILNAGAAYILTAAKHIVTSICGVMHIELPTIGAGGKITDAKNSMESDVYRRMHILNALTKAGFLNEKQVQHIVNEQGQVVLFGNPLINIITQYNNKMTNNEAVATSLPTAENPVAESAIKE